MNIDYNDQRFQQVNAEKQTALNKVDNTYNTMINQSEKYYNDLAKATENYGKQQQELQQQRTDFAIDQIKQNKQWAEQDYIKEQKGAYQDLKNQTDRYGSNAEQMAQNGLLGTGYSEYSNAIMYNAYQNRVATARESYNRSVVEYDNQIKDAMMQNNATLAELAYNTLKAKLEYSLEGFQYKNNLIQTQLKMQNDTEDRYYTRWQNVLNQLNKEAEFKESQRQYNEKMAYQKERDRVSDEQWQKEYALSQQKIAASNNTSAINKNNTTVDKSNNEQYQIVSTNPNDGWSKTNLKQQFSDGSVADVFKDPSDGKLKFWDPYNNEWVNYGGNSRAGGGTNAIGHASGGGVR